MPRTTVTYKFDRDAYTKATNLEIEKIFREAALEFAEYVAGAVPVLSGMARGSLLARVRRFSGAMGRSQTYLNYEGDFDINKDRLARRYKLFHKLPRLADGEIKNKYAGARRSQYSFYNIRGDYSFVFRSNVKHYELHEPSWQSMTIGMEYFDKYVEEALKTRMPQVKDYVKAD